MRTNLRALRTGYTTGACAAAATKASLSMLLGGRPVNGVSIMLPGGRKAGFAVKAIAYSGTEALTCVKKDGGDDPDVTSGLLICSEVRLMPSLPDGEIEYLQGDGVGTVTLQGLGIPVGGPAINQVPRTMISDIVRTLLAGHGCSGGVSVRISVPGGREVAQKTMNARLGIVDGISIIGTSGIVVPYSEEAYLDAIRTMLKVAAENDVRMLAISAGARSEKVLRDLFPSLPGTACVHYGNHIGKTLEMIRESGSFSTIAVGVMLAKATKLACGELDLSSRTVGHDLQFIANLARSAGYDGGTVAAMEQISLIRSIVDIIPFAADEPFYSELLRLCYEACRRIVSGLSLTFVLISEDRGSISYDGQTRILHENPKTGVE